MKLGIGLSICRYGSNAGAKMPSSAVFDLDATIVSSYGGTGQTWTNLVPAPADGEASSAYNFTLGTDAAVSTDDPTFTGTAGSPSAYFLFDGGDRVAMAANTTFINSLHKTTGGTDFTFGFAFRNIDSSAIRLAGTTFTTGALGAGVTKNTNETIVLVQGNGTSQVSSTGSPTLLDATDYVLLVSCAAGGGNVRYWVNGVRSNGTIAYNTATGDASGIFRAFSTIITGTRLYGLSMFKQFIGDAEASAILETYRTRHGRAYA